MGETLIPTCSFRWLRDYDGERLLQQRFVTFHGQEVWRDVPEVEHADAIRSSPDHGKG